MLIHYFTNLTIILILEFINGTFSDMLSEQLSYYMNHTNMKFILILTPWQFHSAPFNETYRDIQNDPFRAQSCEYQNCYYTIDKGLLGSEADFHAILFYGLSTNKTIFPKERSQFQYYVDVMDEPNVYYPMDKCYLNNFFNLTATYKLDSDIPWPYLIVIDKTDDNAIVGPRIDMEWKESPKTLNKEYLSKLYGKTELGAWFLSHCDAYNGRNLFGYTLNQEINARSNLTLDVFGRCSYFKCPSPELPTYEDCNQMLSDNYLFYLAFENSDTEDYVTEKLLRALQNNVVPIVYGGADYSRFLPPKSYINAKKLGTRKTAKLMINLYKNRKAYTKYFNWKNTYEYRDNVMGYSCELCAILNSNSSEPRTHPRFTDWWNGWDTSSSSEPNSIHCTYDTNNTDPTTFLNIKYINVTLMNKNSVV